MLIHKVVHRDDFQRLLAARPRSRSAHFALHHAPALPPSHLQRRAGPSAIDLSTDEENSRSAPVDNNLFGYAAVIPKRHAKRSVTRNLLRRQIRGAFLRHAGAMARGLWLVRLRAPWAVSQFPAAASKALALASSAELDALMVGAAARRPA